MKLLTITYICIKMCQLFSGRFTHTTIGRPSGYSIQNLYSIPIAIALE